MSTTDLSAWLGKSQTVVDRMDPGHVARVAVTLGRPIPELGAVLPALWHWAFFLETVPIAQTGTDGHPARGSFLPPADNRNRMWAGGRVNFDGGLLVGTEAHKTSTVTAIKEKAGRQVLHQHIGLGQQLLKNRPSIRVFQVEREAFF